jgi:hypothetical protein
LSITVVAIGARFLGWVSRNLHWILLGALVIAAVLFVYVKGRVHERDLWKPKNEALQTEITQLKKDHREASDRSVEERRAEVESVRKLNLASEENNAARLQAVNARADSLLSELLRLRAASRLRPLAPSSAAPAPCRDYEADPTRLSDAHVGFLIGEARAGAACVEQARSCSAYALGLRAICSGTD